MHKIEFLFEYFFRGIMIFKIQKYLFIKIYSFKKIEVYKKCYDWT